MLVVNVSTTENQKPDQPYHDTYEDVGYDAYNTDHQTQQPPPQNVEVGQQKPATGLPRNLVGVVDISVLKTPSGIALIVNIVLLFLTTCIMGGWRAATGFNWFLFVDGYNFFIATTMLPLVTLILFAVIFILKFDKNLPNINFSFGLLINCAFWALLLMISSSIVFGISNRYHCELWKCAYLEAIGSFGFLCVFGLIIQAVLIFIELRTRR